MSDVRRKPALHWQILIGMAAGILVGMLVDFAAGQPSLTPAAEYIVRLGSWVGKLFLGLLKMLIVPLIFTSLITGMTSVPDMKSLGRMSGWTLAFYLSTSMMAITTGLVLVNIIGPGRGLSYQQLVAHAEGGGAAPPAGSKSAGDDLFGVIGGVIERMVPDNIINVASNNGSILGVIFFALLLGLFIKKTGGEHARIMTSFFNAFFEVLMRMTSFVIGLAPYGIFGVMVALVGRGGLWDIAGDLGKYMLVVAIGLVLHGAFTLPLLVRVLAGRSPLEFARSMAPALLTAFSTASSNATLPLTMRCAEERAGISGQVTSFTLPLGATINMDGTALYEAVAVLFIAQTLGDLTLSQQVVVAFTALAASVGAAGIPHAGLVMMVIVLEAVGLPTEAVMIILAVDRLLDMGRTTINVWSDSCAAAVVARRIGLDEQRPS